VAYSQGTAFAPCRLMTFSFRKVADGMWVISLTLLVNAAFSVEVPQAAEFCDMPTSF